VSERSLVIAIDRVVLSGIAITPERAERFRALLTSELAWHLQQRDPSALLGRAMPDRLAASAIQLGEEGGDRAAASLLARSIADSVCNASGGRAVSAGITEGEAGG
jgi:hypothetical protein